VPRAVQGLPSCTAASASGPHGRPINKEHAATVHAFTGFSSGKELHAEFVACGGPALGEQAGLHRRIYDLSLVEEACKEVERQQLLPPAVLERAAHSVKETKSFAFEWKRHCVSHILPINLFAAPTASSLVGSHWSRLLHCHTIGFLLQ
jgi:hypothetical protein